jgi:hypothetical protein
MEYYHDLQGSDLYPLLDYRVSQDMTLSYPPGEAELEGFLHEVEARLIAIVLKQNEVINVDRIHHVVGFLLDNLITLKSIALSFGKDIQENNEALYTLLDKVIFETHTLLNLYHLYKRMIPFTPDDNSPMEHLDENIHYRLFDDGSRFPDDCNINLSTMVDLSTGIVRTTLNDIIEYQSEIQSTIHIQRVLAFLITNYIALKGFDMFFGYILENACSLLYAEYQDTIDKYDKLISFYHMYKTYC